MARIDIKVTKDDSGRFTVEAPFQQLTSLSEEEAGELASQLLSKLGCSFEIKWPHLQPTAEDKLRQQRALRARVKEDAELWAAANHLLPENRNYDSVIEAYQAGWSAAPKPVTSVIR